MTPPPPPSAVDRRLAAFPTTDLPLEQPLTIYWNEHQVPFIDAGSDADAAFALGLVHAHLRLGQMAIYRQIAQGRIAEMGGPLARDIDHGVRLLGFGRAAAQSRAAMAPEARVWLDRFVAGINHYQRQAATLPVEYRILGLAREPWTAEDVLTFGRLAGTDVSWLVWFNLLGLRDRPDWPQIWARLLQQGGDGKPAADADVAALAELLAQLSRSGSNSLAVAPARTVGGAAILANDPHLGLNIPNTWLIAGLRSPSYHVVGLMVPGLPVFGIGRNPQIAWGGTNMRASVSDLIDVSQLASDAIRERDEVIRVRWWPDETITIRETDWGPLLSDAPQLRALPLPPLALRWTGHRPSDEIGAMLGVARATDFAGFRDALAGFAMPGQNMLYADAAGNIGKVYAVRVPDRRGPPPADVVLTPAEAAPIWRQTFGAGELPVVYNPPAGFIASANNRPPADVPAGYFFSPDDRVQRLGALVDAQPQIAIADVAGFQQDVYVASSVALRDALVRRIDALGLGEPTAARERRLLQRLRAWDGHYRVDSEGAVAFELLRATFTGDFYQARFGSSGWAAFAGVGRIKELLVEDLEAADATTLAPLLARSLGEAAAAIDAYPRWGDMHRLVLQHPLAFLPVVGGRFRFSDDPVAGSTDALMKTAHPTTVDRHKASYGSNARHISDLGDPDANHFVILGGQDGWLNSSTFLDQVALWRAGGYIRMPLRMETVRAEFPMRMELTP